MKNIITILLVFCSVLAFGQTSMRSGISEHWRWQNNANGEKGNNGSLFGDATYSSSGIRGDCLTLDGVGDYATTPSISNYGIESNDFSISLWLNPDALSGLQYLISNRTAGASQDVFQLRTDGTTIDFQIATLGVIAQIDISNVGSLSNGTWYNIVVTCDVSTSTCLLYSNGVQIGSDTYAGSLPTLTDNIIVLGIYYPTTASEVDGRIDEVIVSNRVWSELEVVNNYNSGNGILYVQENFKQNKNYNKLIGYVLNGLYLAWIN